MSTHVSVFESSKLEGQYVGGLTVVSFYHMLDTQFDTDPEMNSENFGVQKSDEMTT